MKLSPPPLGVPLLLLSLALGCGGSGDSGSEGSDGSEASAVTEGRTGAVGTDSAGLGPGSTADSTAAPAPAPGPGPAPRAGSQAPGPRPSASTPHGQGGGDGEDRGDGGDDGAEDGETVLDERGFLVAVITLPGATAFLKVDGPGDRVEGLLETVREMSRSFSVGTELAWETPAGFQQHAETGMSLASFTIEGQPSVTVKLTVLGGSAGGLRNNVQRWIGQLGWEVPEPATLETFLDEQERFLSKGGLDVVLVDLIEPIGS